MSSSADDLQFHRADYGATPAAGPTCPGCRQPIQRVYYMVGKQAVCERCRTSVQASLTGGSGAARFLRAAVAGLLAATAGALIYFGISALTGYEFGLVAIVVGLMVGGAVRWGCHGRGGWSYQALAMALTYVAIVTTYVPQIVQSLRQMAAAQGTVTPTPQASARSSTASKPATSTATRQQRGPRLTRLSSHATPGQFLMAWGFVLMIAFTAPFLGGLRNLMGLIIIGIGLYEAWKMNRRVPVELSGPFVLTPTNGQPTST